MGIKGTQPSVFIGWNPAWGATPVTTKIHMGPLDYQRFRYSTWAMDWRFLTLFGKVRLVWLRKRFWPSIILFYWKGDFVYLDSILEKLGFGHTPDIVRGKTGADSSNAESSSARG